ncbi:alpha/beta hydrolase [Streptomyces griseus]|uniref:alpha/beta hydrolase n=1 Tax=Streptomyces griseus TaxID=1911 RepID=UPI0033ED26C6
MVGRHRRICGPAFPAVGTLREEADTLSAVLLVHGLYHRPQHFGRVAERLRAAGVEVVAPELHRGSLSADTAAVQAAVDLAAEPPLVLGHSYGGSVITGVRGAGRLVYLAAFVPDTGETSAAGTASSTPLCNGGWPSGAPRYGNGGRVTPRSWTGPASSPNSWRNSCGVNRSVTAPSLLFDSLGTSCSLLFPTLQEAPHAWLI